MGLSQRQAVLLMYVISAVLALPLFCLPKWTATLPQALLHVIISGVALGAKKIGILNDR